MAHDDRAVGPRRVEHGERVGGEVRGRVALSGASAFAVAPRIGRDEPEPTGDRIGEEIPITAVVPDAVEEQRGCTDAGPRPVDELGAVANDHPAFRHRGHSLFDHI